MISSLDGFNLMDVNAMADLITAIGVPGVLAWYLWFDTAVSRPKRHEAEQAHMQSMAKNYNDTIERVAKDFTQTIKEERVMRREEIGMLRDEMRRLRGLDDTVNREA